jgi:ribosomal protein S18 acetylase RimI-like enzyme
MENLKVSIGRFVMGLNRYSKASNMRRLQERGETVASITVREMTEEDIPALAALHVKTWADTYWLARNPPAYKTREYQWREQFKANDGSWFCYLAENKIGKLVGFARGQTYDHADLPDYSGELNKIYLLREYQRLGLGKKLLCSVAREFLNRGINNMLLFSEAKNPSGYFYEALGADRLYSKAGAFHGGYGWKDLRELAKIC